MMVFTLLWGVPYLLTGQQLSPAAVGALLTLFVLCMIVIGPALGLLDRPAPAAPLLAGARGDRRRGDVWTAVLLQPGPAPLWLLVLLIVVLAAAGPGSIVGIDISRTANPRRSLGVAQSMTNLGGFLASLVVLAGMGAVMTALGGFTPEAFRVAWLLQYPVWAIAVVGVLVNRRQARALDASAGWSRARCGTCSPGPYIDDRSRDDRQERNTRARSRCRPRTGGRAGRRRRAAAAGTAGRRGRARDEGARQRPGVRCGPGQREADRGRAAGRVAGGRGARRGGPQRPGPRGLALGDRPAGRHPQLPQRLRPVVGLPGAAVRGRHPGRGGARPGRRRDVQRRPRRRHHPGRRSGRAVGRRPAGRGHRRAELQPVPGHQASDGRPARAAAARGRRRPPAARRARPVLPRGRSAGRFGLPGHQALGHRGRAADRRGGRRGARRGRRGGRHGAGARRDAGGVARAVGAARRVEHQRCRRADQTAPQVPPR